MSEPFGYEALNPTAGVEECLRDLAAIVHRARLEDGGTPARPVGYSAKSTEHGVDTRVLAGHKELTRALHDLQVQLLALRRRAWSTLLAPLPDESGANRKSRAAQDARIRASTWSSADLARAENLPVRLVTELRKRSPNGA